MLKKSILLHAAEIALLERDYICFATQRAAAAEATASWEAGDDAYAEVQTTLRAHEVSTSGNLRHKGIPYGDLSKRWDGIDPYEVRCDFLLLLAVSGVR